MAFASPVAVAVNPNDKAQRYVLWGNGRIDNFGGAPPIPDNPKWYDRADQPVAVGIHITDWAAAKGYVFDFQGGFQPFGGAPAITIVGNDTVTNNNGLPYADYRRYIDWYWDPAGSGQGYALDVHGEIVPFGGADPPPRTGPRWDNASVARRLEMLWTPTDKKALTLDAKGGIHPDFTATPVVGAPYWDYGDIARDFVVTDWTTGKGYTLDFWGAAQAWGGAPAAYGGPYQKGADVARILYVLNASNPTRFWQVQSGGQQYEYISSTPPTVTAGGTAASPPATVTTTTRPTLAWDYSDAQGDSQDAWEVYVFTQAFVTDSNMADPSQWAASALAVLSGNDPSQRGITADLDFTNGSYRFYVRAKDTADQWSAWSNRGWVQNVPVPATPTNLTATPEPATYSVALSVNATTGGAADAVRFDKSDDDGLTWSPVRGAEAVPLAATTTARDYDIPLGVERLYRAFAFNNAPRTISAASASDSAIIPAATYVLTSTADATLGGRILVSGPVSWTRPVRASVKEGIGAEFPVVVSDGGPKARRLPLTLTSLSREAWERVDALVRSNSTLVYRDPLGDVAYVRVVGDFGREMLKGAATRHEHSVTLPLVEVAPPIQES